MALNFPANPQKDEVYTSPTGVDYTWDGVRWNVSSEVGPAGPEGPAGPGVPTGGSAGQVLAKVDSTDYNTEWVEQTGDGYWQLTAGGIYYPGDITIGAGGVEGGQLTLKGTNGTTSVGNLDVDGSDDVRLFTIRNNTDIIIGQLGGTGGTVGFYSAGLERARVTDNGLTFNGDTAAANALDDFEEGNWTPMLSSDSPGTGNFVPAGANGGFYTKIGKKVFFQFNLNGTWTKGTAVGSVRITGLPFVVAAMSDRPGNSAYGSVIMPYIDGLDISAGLVPTGGLCLPGLTSMHVYAQNNTSSFNIGIETAAQNALGINIHGGGSYEVA